MNDIHNLSSGEFYIFSDVSGRPIDLCRIPPAPREPVIVGEERLGFRFITAGENTYEIWTGDRHIRSVGDHIYGSLERIVPQKWVIIARASGDYTIETQDRRAWSDPGGNPGCEHKLYLHSVWQPISPQQTFKIRPAVD
ncbi:hypothetical protein SCLCIDRAFT_572429 [Scleroderma citrinum Foug A]|uniref:Carbohydrate-binding module family 13 protein n=1 Tax=Scleroderma citrinum Foug A TaxID=1036808 RepID=A0A0C2YR62_9AGAM|nr:hypothetical protein SCLCIDRAFT_572429 [Scleroderma citrinum Foug A]